MPRYRLSRTSYFWLSLIYAAWLTHMIDTEEIRNLAMVAFSLPPFFLFIVMARIRDADWPLWVTAIVWIPLIGDFIAPGILLSPPKHFFRRGSAARAEATRSPDLNRTSSPSQLGPSE